MTKVLHLALQYDVRKDLVKLLLQAGADIQIQDAEGKKPIDLAHNKDPGVQEILQECQEIANFLSKLHLEEFCAQFIKVGATITVLSTCSEEELELSLDRIGITALGTCLRIKSAIAELKSKKKKNKYI